MKLRKVKRLIRRTKKQLERGTFKGRIAPVSYDMAGAVFVVDDVLVVLKITSNDCMYCRNKDGSYFLKNHKHWVKPRLIAYLEAVAVSYA